MKYWLLAACLALHAQECPATRYCATLAVKDGRIVRTSPSQPLDANFDAQLAKLPKPYRLALTVDDQALDDAGNLPSVTTLRNFPAGTIVEYFTALQSWCDAAPNCQDAADNILSVAGLFRAFSGYQDAGLLFNVESDELNLETGRVVFRVAPNFNADTVTIDDLPKHRVTQLRHWLRPLNGKVWNRPAVAARLLTFYSALGLDPQITSDIEQNTIRILEGSRIQGIAFPFGLPVKGTATDWNKVDQALYASLPDKDFRSGYLARRNPIRNKLEANDTPELSYETDLLISLAQAPYLSRLRLPTQQLLLQQSGFSLAVTTPVIKLVNNVQYSLAYYRLEDISAAPPASTAVAAAPATADSNGHVTPTAATVLPGQAPPIKTTAADCIDDPGQKPKTRYAGFGITYKPGQGLRAFGLAQQNFTNSGLSVRAGQGGPGTPLATANFTTDYIAFSRLHRRLAFSLQGGTDTEANRYINGAKQNEQRTGARARLELELFRDRNGHLLKFFTEPARTKVTLGAVSTTNTIDLGAVHIYESSGSPYPWTWRLEPTLRWGVATSTVQQHQRASASARFHRQLPKGWATDIAAQAAFASASTPLFDQPSLGGADSLRGFRRDDAVAIRLWTLQPELWAPVYTNLFLALFHDIGNAGDLSTTPRRGPGLGLRYVAGPAVLRVDWAFGLGPAATGGSRAKFYFSVTTNLPY